MWLSIGGIFVANLLGIFTDWLFMSALFHDAYGRYPEIWRMPGKNVTAIVGAQVLGLLMTIAVFALCSIAHVDGVMSGVTVALITWAAGPLPICVINGLFIKLDEKVTVAHSLGYLARMSIAGVAAGLVLPPT